MEQSLDPRIFTSNYTIYSSFMFRQGTLLVDEQRMIIFCNPAFELYLLCQLKEWDKALDLLQKILHHRIDTYQILSEPFIL